MRRWLSWFCHLASFLFKWWENIAGIDFSFGPWWCSASISFLPKWGRLKSLIWSNAGLHLSLVLQRCEKKKLNTGLKTYDLKMWLRPVLRPVLITFSRSMSWSCLGIKYIFTQSWVRWSWLHTSFYSRLYCLVFNSYEGLSKQASQCENYN